MEIKLIGWAIAVEKFDILRRSLNVQNIAFSGKQMNNIVHQRGLNCALNNSNNEVQRELSKYAFKTYPSLMD